MHVIKQNVDGGATEADGGASAPVGPSVATPYYAQKFTYYAFEHCSKKLHIMLKIMPIKINYAHAV